MAFNPFCVLVRIRASNTYMYFIFFELMYRYQEHVLLLLSRRVQLHLGFSSTGIQYASKYCNIDMLSIHKFYFYVFFFGRTCNSSPQIMRTFACHGIKYTKCIDDILQRYFFDQLLQTHNIYIYIYTTQYFIDFKRKPRNLQRTRIIRTIFPSQNFQVINPHCKRSMRLSISLNR